MKTALPLPQRLSEVLCPIAIATAIFFFAGCQKEVNLDTPTPPISVLGDSIYLEGIYDLDSISPTQIDTQYYSKFEYDNLKRVIKFIDHDYGVIPHRVISTTNYLYNGQDTLPYTSSTVSSQGTSTRHSSYSSNGKLLTDSIRLTSGEYFVWKYIPIASGYRYIEIRSSANGMYYDTTILMQTIQNGNIVRETETDFVNPDIHHIYEYDNNPNPVDRLNLYNAPVMHNALQVDYQGVSRNNISKRTRESGSIQNSVTVQYFYHANGLPYRSYARYQFAGPGGNQGILHYVYTDL